MNDVIKCFESYCKDKKEFFPHSWKINSITTDKDACHILLDTIDKRSPQLFIIKKCGNSPTTVIPFFEITNHRDRQIMSYVLGEGLCNLAEIKEINGRLYSRYCGSYTNGEIVHRSREYSVIALWVHDCLVEDFDHRHDLNRHYLENGSCISFDFGMSLSNKYFPPFYYMELGITDNMLKDHRDFILNLIIEYAKRSRLSEEDVLTKIKERYPKTANRDLCLYNLRYYSIYLAERLYYGRIFHLLKNTSYPDKEMSSLLKLLQLENVRISKWETFIEMLRSSKCKKLDLSGLNLVGADLRRADLRGANLRGTNLMNANLKDANMENADLREAILDGAILPNRN